MPSLNEVLSEFDPFTLLRDVQTKVVRPAASWLKEDGALDPGAYERQRHRGARAVMGMIAGAGEVVLVEVHAEHKIHAVISRLEPELRDAFDECIPLACQEAAGELRRALPYADVSLVEIEGYALTALFAHACSWRQHLGDMSADKARAQALWTPPLRKWLRVQIRSSIKQSAKVRLAETTDRADRAEARERHAKNVGEAAGKMLLTMTETMINAPGFNMEDKANAQRMGEIARRALGLGQG